MAGLLEGKKILIAGVTNDDSIAYAASQFAQEQGAEVVWTSVGRIVRIAERVARRLPDPPDVIDLDVTDEDSIASLGTELASRWGRLDGMVHAISNANPETCLGGDIMKAPWEDVSRAMHISAYSLMALARMAVPLMKDGGGSIVGLDFDNSTVAWPVYDWMGVAKAAFESTCRYLARDLGPLRIRVNLVAAGPLRTLSAKSIPGFEAFEEVWTTRAPLGWDLRDTTAAGRACVALLSDWFPATTGEIVHVDGGFHAVGA
jgi:meromycolic acid enoyl-[acyl-carrier-protein] reductase